MNPPISRLFPFWLFGWLVLVSGMLAVRTVLPIDETRYIAVAWEMWSRNSQWVPLLNGEYYQGKPPLFFWLMELGWLGFGVTDWWARLVAPLFGLLSLFLTAALARRLWQQPEVALLAPTLLLGSGYWAVFSSAVMFDMLVSAFALIAVLALVRVWQGGGRGNFWLAGGALGLGILAKGPVVLLAPAFVAILAPWWMGATRPLQFTWRDWFVGCLQALGIAAVVPLIWLIPMAIEAGPGYVVNLVWGQTTGYMVTTFAHARPWWWYLPILPLMLFPWTFWPEAWRAIWRVIKLGLDPATRLCLAWSLPTIVVFSLFIGKQAHYLLPIFPALSLLLARGLLAYSPSAVRFPLPAYVFGFFGFVWLLLPLLMHAEHPPEWATELSLIVTWSAAAIFFALAFVVSRWYRRLSVQGRVNLLAGSTWLALLVIGGGIFHATWPAYDVRPASQFIAGLEKSGAPIGMVAKNHGAYHFFGRLTEPIQRVEKDGAAAWAKAHPDGYLIVYYRSGQVPAYAELSPVYQQLFRGDTMAIWRSDQVAQHPDMAAAFK